MNPGKQFELDFKNSVPEDVYIERLPDPVQSFFRPETLRYSPSNPYDFMMYYYPHLYCMELKSTKATSFTYWKEEFEVAGRLPENFNIRKNQILGLREANKAKGVISGFVLNFRSSERTYFLPIDSFDELCEITKKKSISEPDLQLVHSIQIPQRLKRVHYEYDIKGFMKAAEEYYEQI